MSESEKTTTNELGTSIYPQIYPGGRIALRSTLWENAYLSVDQGMSSPNGAGGGTVTCKYLAPTTASLADNFLLKPYFSTNGGGIFCFESVKYPKNYLRLDGNYASQSNQQGPEVNLQYWDTPPVDSSNWKASWEVFRVSIQPGSPFGENFIQSVLFKHAYIYFDGSGVSASGGTGKVAGGYANTQGSIITGWYDLP